MDFAFGMIGFVGFEALRLYKCQWSGRSIIPAKQIGWYLITLLAVSLFSGSAAFALAEGSIGKALFVGFSVPCNAKVIFEKGESRRTSMVEVDDVDPSAEAQNTTLSIFIKTYFGLWSV
jgi:hypothetical protein